MINNGKTLNRLWGALISDFELLMGKFMDSPGWEFVHFAKICRDMQISLIMNMALGRGKSKDEHYECISSIILQTAKGFWLRARDSTFGDAALDRKRRVGGFYLTYIMYLKQPYPGRTKINMDMDDLTLVKEFIEDVNVMQNAQEVYFGMCVLIVEKAYSYNICSDEFGVEGWRRIVMTNQKSETVLKCFEMRDVQDQLAYGSQRHIVDRQLMHFNYVKNKFAESMKKTVLSPHLKHIIGLDNTLFGMFTKTECIAEFRSAVTIITELTNEPVLTLEQLTATDSIDRRILAETRRRIQRQRKKIMEEPGKASKPYVREGGIYGRKKEVDEEKENKERRERGMCSGNLWTYINGLSFDKPLGHLAEESRATGAQSAPAEPEIKPEPDV